MFGCIFNLFFWLIALCLMAHIIKCVLKLAMCLCNPAKREQLLSVLRCCFGNLCRRICSSGPDEVTIQQYPQQNYYPPPQPPPQAQPQPQPNYPPPEVYPPPQQYPQPQQQYPQPQQQYPQQYYPQQTGYCQPCCYQQPCRTRKKSCCKTSRCCKKKQKRCCCGQ